jgi:hypothetical protein
VSSDLVQRLIINLQDKTSSLLWKPKLHYHTTIKLEPVESIPPPPQSIYLDYKNRMQCSVPFHKAVVTLDRKRHECSIMLQPVRGKNYQNKFKQLFLFGLVLLYGVVN